MERFDATKCKREHFANIFSLKAAIWCGNICNQILDKKEKGYSFFYDGRVMNPEFKFEYGEDFTIGYKTSPNTTEVWVGFEHAGVKGEWKVWCSKKELTEILKRIKFVNPKELKSIV